MYGNGITQVNTMFSVFFIKTSIVVSKQSSQIQLLVLIYLFSTFLFCSNIRETLVLLCLLPPCLSEKSLCQGNSVQPLQTVYFSLFRNQTSEVQSWAKYCPHLINLLITSHILLIQCQSNGKLLLIHLQPNCSSKRMHKCFFGQMPELLGSLPHQAPCEYIFLT